jgi:hypothetical protein
MSIKDLQNAVIEAAIAVCDNAAFLPCGTAQVPVEIAEALGDRLSDLADAEKKKYAKFLSNEQTGLNSAQVALQRLNMPEPQLTVERIVDAADQLYLSLFDEVIIPGRRYLIASQDQANTKGVRYLQKDSIESFRVALAIQGS